MSAPMPNPFDYNSASHVPVDAGSGAVTLSPPSEAAPEVIHQSSACEGNGSNVDGSETSDGSTRYSAAIDSCQEPVAADDHINEIFFYARKLIADGRRFVLDEAAFLAAIDEEPLFLRQANG